MRRISRACCSDKTLAGLGTAGKSRLLTEAQAVAQLNHPNPGHMLKQFFIVRSRALRAAGRAAEADEYLRKARERVMLVAGKIEDETLRRGWLENVRLNRELLAEWAARGL